MDRCDEQPWTKDGELDEIPGRHAAHSAWRRRVLVGSLIVLLPVIVLSGAWRLGGASASEDDLIYYLPVRQYIGECIRQGHWPLWNPYVCMGTSLAADPQSGLWYPSTLLFALLPALLAYPLSIILHFSLAGGGMYRWLRANRLDWRAALIGGIAFEFSGFLIAHRAHLTLHHAAACIPWILLFWQRFADTGRRKYWTAAAAAFGLQMLVQHIQVSIMTAVIVTGYVAYVPGPRRKTLWWQYPVGMTLGAMMAAIQLLPTFLYYAGSSRGAAAFHTFIENSWYPSSALMLLFPLFFGCRTPNGLVENWWGISHLCEQYAYGSIAVLVLAVASFPLLRKPQAPELALATEMDERKTAETRRFVRFWWLASLLALLIALGEFTPLCKVLFHVPIYRNLRVPARWILVWSLAMPCLAAVTTSALIGHARRKNKTSPHTQPWPSRITSSVHWVATRLLPIATALALGVILMARLLVGRLEVWYPHWYVQPIWAGIRSAVRWNNPALLWPLAMMATTIWLLHRVTSPSPQVPTTTLPMSNAKCQRNFKWLLVLVIVDLGSVAALIDVDTRLYTRSDLTTRPALAQAIDALQPRPGDRLLVPRYSADYHRPLEVLWPQCNMYWRIPTFNGYGPFWPTANRLLLRFMPWGSSEEILTLLRQPALLRAFGVRFIAVRSEEENTQLLAAAWPAEKIQHPVTLHSSTEPQPIRQGQDAVWPISIDAAGVYELALEVQGTPGSASRWFVGLEDETGQEIGRTRSVEPVDLAAGPRTVRFEFICPQPIAAHIRIKSEVGQALAIGRATITRVATPTTDKSLHAPAYLEAYADLPSGIRLYELADTADLLYWTHHVTSVPDVRTAVDILQQANGPALTSTVIEQAADNRMAPASQPDPDGYPPKLEHFTYEGSGRPPWRPTNSSGNQTAARDGGRYTQTKIALTWSRPTNEQLRATVEAPTDGFVVFNETFDAGWRVTVDGQPQPLRRANAIVQAVAVPAGRHEVVFSYHPRGLDTGVGLSLAGLIGLAISLGWRQHVGKRSPTTPASP